MGAARPASPVNLYASIPRRRRFVVHDPARARMSPRFWPTLEEQRETREMMGWDAPIRLPPVDEWGPTDDDFSEPGPSAADVPLEIPSVAPRVARWVLPERGPVAGPAARMTTPVVPYWARRFDYGWPMSVWSERHREDTWCLGCGCLVSRGPGRCQLCGWVMP